MDFHKDWNNPEMGYVRKERMQDIRDTKRADWFATFSCILAMVGLITIEPNTTKDPGIVTIIVVVVALGCYMVISLIVNHTIDRESYRQNIIDSLPEQSGTHKPYCLYLEGLEKNTRKGDWISCGQILATAMTFVVFLITA